MTDPARSAVLADVTFESLTGRPYQLYALYDLLAKSVHGAGWSAFVSMLEYKAARHGRTFVRVGRFEPTSQVCSACRLKDGPKPLHVRTWMCGACGTTHDRDVNAAINILAAGRVERLNACGGTVSPAA